MRIRKQGPFDEGINNEDILTAAKIADALAHPARIRMLRYILTENLARRTVTNKDLVNTFNYAQATISQHISKLLIGGLLDVRKRGTSSCYFTRIGMLTLFTEILKKLEAPGEVNERPDLRTEVYAIDDIYVELDDELNPEYSDEPAIDLETDDETPSFL